MSGRLGGNLNAGHAAYSACAGRLVARPRALGRPAPRAEKHSLADFLLSLTKLGAVGVMGLGLGLGRGERPSVGWRARLAAPLELLPLLGGSCVVLCAPSVPSAPAGTSRRYVPWLAALFAM